MKVLAFIFRWIIRIYLTAWFRYDKINRTGGCEPGRAFFISQAYQPVGNRLKDGLFRYHVKQFHDASCSVATVASVVNTLSACRGVEHPAVSQRELLEKVRTAHWKERMGDGGYRGKRGLPLAVLGEVVKESLTVFKLPHQAVEILKAPRQGRALNAYKRTLRARLERFEKQGDCLIISHFDQGCFVPEFHIPHISPVGGFDAGQDLVTLLDVDPAQKRPYRISFNTWINGLSSRFNHVFRPFGYDGGGVVIIRL